MAKIDKNILPRKTQEILKPKTNLLPRKIKKST